MTKFNSNLGPSCIQEGEKRARSSNHSDKAKNEAHEKGQISSRVIEDQDNMFLNSPRFMLTALFIFAVIMEVLFSFPMYIDLMSQMTGEKNSMMALVGVFFIVLWGAIVSYLLAKKISQSVFAFTVYNVLKSSHNTIPYYAAEEKAIKTTYGDFILGLVLGIFLLVVVAVISWQRVLLFHDITGVDYSLLHKLLPVICVIIEIISGIYLDYFIHRFKEYRKVKKFHKEFVKEGALCECETQMAYDYYQQAVKNGEELLISREYDEALARYEHNSQRNEINLIVVKQDLAHLIYKLK